MAGKAILTCRPNSHLFQERTLVLDQPVKIGRSVARARAAPNNAIFDCKVLSRNHAVFWYTNGKFYLQDTKSSNGTFVNNQRLSKSGEESLPREVCSGDIVQFGVDVIENTRKVTHGCIIANLKLYLPDGKEAKASHSSSILSSNSVPVEDLYELHQYLQEATQREHMLETKLFALQEVLNSIKEAADQGWKALIAEDRLLTRVEALENQLQAYSKNYSEDKLKDELVKLQEEKNQYQNTAKEFLKKVLDEKLEAVQKCQEVKRSLVNVEAAYSSLTDEMGKSHASIQELAHKLSVQLVKNEDTEMKLQELETKHKEAIERLENRNKELEKMLAIRHAAAECLEKQLTDLRLSENMANEKAIAYEIQLKTFNNYSTVTSENDELVYDLDKLEPDYKLKEEHKIISPLLLEENKSVEARKLLTAQLDLLQAEQRSKLPQYIEDEKPNEEDALINKTLQMIDVQLKDSVLQHCPDSFPFEKKTEIRKGSLNGGFTENVGDLESDDKGSDSETKDPHDACDLNFSLLKDSLDTIKMDLNKSTDNSVLAQEKIENVHKNYEDCSVIAQVLKDQTKMHNQFKHEQSDTVDNFQNCQNKKNQEQDESLLRRQLLEAQQSAKQSRNEQAQLMDRIIALTAELESKNLSDDNKIKEKLFETQQECNKLKSTISTLQSEFMSLKEKCSQLEEERNNLQEKLERYRKEKNSQTGTTGKQYEELNLKICKLQEELVIVGSKYMECNQERTKISKELSNLRLDYQAISHQPYFNLIFALPCIVLILAITIAFYPTLSQIMGTAEHNNDPGTL